MGKGSSSPPPTPDYTAQKNQLRLDTEKAYKNQANAYNKSVGNYNKQVYGFEDRLGSLKNQIGGLTYADLYDDPNTTANENPYSSLRSQLDSVSTGLRRLGQAPTAPTFSTMVNSAYGPVSISNIPSLNLPAKHYAGSLSGDAQNYLTQLDALNTQRRDEENRINQFRTRSLGDLSGYSSQLGQMGIADLNRMNQLEKDLASFDVGRQSFSSPILNQMFPSGLSQIESQYTGLMEGLADLRGQRENELKRISDYENALLTDADTYRNTLGGLTIADEQGINDLINQIEDRNRQAGRFSSELGFDFNQELGELRDLLGDVRTLESDRTRELDRIKRAEQDYLSGARGIESAAEGGSIYSLSGIDSIEDALRDIRTDMGGFTSQLDFDFSPTSDVLLDADTALTGLRDRRSAALDDIVGQITGSAGNIAGLEDYDEEGMRAIQTQLGQAGGDLGRFSGGRVDDITAQLTDATSQIDGRLTELAEARKTLEERAQALLTQVNNAQYYAVDDLGDNQGSFDALQAEIELYNAQQALDEISAAETRLNSERQRLERDAEAVAERDRIARENILSTVGESGLPEFENYDQIDPVTLGQYLALLQSQEDDEFVDQITPSAFVQNVLRT